jgi:hypothetical protein
MGKVIRRKAAVNRFVPDSCHDNASVPHLHDTGARRPNHALCVVSDEYIKDAFAPAPGRSCSEQNGRQNSCSDKDPSPCVTVQKLPEKFSRLGCITISIHKMGVARNRLAPLKFADSVML